MVNLSSVCDRRVHYAAISSSLCPVGTRCDPRRRILRREILRRYVIVTDAVSCRFNVYRLVAAAVDLNLRRLSVSYWKLTRFRASRFTDSWESNWVYSEHPGKEFGKFVLTAGKFFNDPEGDKGELESAFVSVVEVRRRA